jgi:archaellum component FlaC
LAYSTSEKFLKKLVGKTDIEDALQRLEKVTVEEARMAGAEALKAIHGVGNQVGDKVDGVQDTLKVVEDKMRGVEGMLQGVGDILQGVDDKVKEIGNKVIIGAQNAFNQSSPLLSLFLPLDVEKPGRQIADDFDKTAHGVDDKIKTIDDTAQSVDDAQQDIKAKVTDGAQVTLNQFLTPS